MIEKLIPKFGKHEWKPTKESRKINETIDVINNLADAVKELQGLISKDADDKDKGKSGKLMIGNREVHPIDTWSLSVDRAKYYEIVAGFTLTDEEAKVMNDAIHRGEPFVFTLQYFNGVIKKVAKDDNG